MDPWRPHDEGKVEELLAVCRDESMLKLSVNTHTITSPAPDSLLLNSDLLDRFQRLRNPLPTPSLASAPPLPHPDPEEVDILGSDLAARLAALKASSPRPVPASTHQDVALEHPQPPLPTEAVVGSTKVDRFSMLNVPDARIGGESKEASVSEVDKLLAAVGDQVKLENKNVGQRERKPDDGIPDECVDVEDEIPDSDVDEMVEWAKDAARLDPSDDEEEKGADDPAEVRDGSIPSHSSTDQATKKAGKRWKVF